MASFTLLPLETLLNIRDHLMRSSDILTLATLNRKNSNHVTLFLYSIIAIRHVQSSYEGPRDENGNLILSDNHPMKERVLKLQSILLQDPSLGSRIKTLDIQLHTGATCMTAGDEIFTLLPHLHRLKHFRLIVEILNHQATPPARENFSPARLASALKESICKTLETLELALGRDYSHTDKTALGDLNSFVALQEFSVQSYVLLGGYRVERNVRNYRSGTMPMLSEILPTNLLHLRIHCGGAEVLNGNGWANQQHLNSNEWADQEHMNRDEALAHFTAPVYWGPENVGHCERGIRTEGLTYAKGLRVLKNVRKCYCCYYPDIGTLFREYFRLSQRLDIVGEDYKPSPPASSGAENLLG